MDGQEKIVLLLSNIKNSGVVRMKYWTVAVTDRAVHIFDMGANALPLGLGTLTDVMTSLETCPKEIDALAKKAAKHYAFLRDNLGTLSIRSWLFGKVLVFSSDSQTQKVRLGPIRSAKFMSAVAALKK